MKNILCTFPMQLGSMNDNSSWKNDKFYFESCLPCKVEELTWRPLLDAILLHISFPSKTTLSVAPVSVNFPKNRLNTSLISTHTIYMQRQWILWKIYTKMSTMSCCCCCRLRLLPLTYWCSNTQREMDCMATWLT